ncbi:MAG: polysaccharide export protein [Gammaproteobacteria bacterium]|nr:polysaccharide export protein [Gammaproteobacteria bacterium]
MVKLLKTGILLALCVLASSVFAQSSGPVGLDASASVDDAAAQLRQPVNSIQLPKPGAKPRPFGSNLFRGGFSNDREDGLNPNYRIMPGDRVSLRVWGAVDLNDSLVVDPQGNIFIPKVGPVAVGGVANKDLNQHVTAAVNRVFTDNVRVYTSLDGSQPVAVFVTGYVPNPGRFSGIPSNSALHFIDRAGGIDSERGSYRNISIIRNSETVASIDLYNFLLKGDLTSIQFRDGDTIVVGERGSSVTVTGDVSNEAVFELQDKTVSGAELVRSALLKPGVSYAGVAGIRSGKPFSTYVPLAEFENLVLYNGDEVHFRFDQHDQVIVVEVEGAHLGPSRYAVPRNTRLLELLDYIEIDTELANADSISLRRKSIADRQKASLNESLARLEARYLTAPSQTDAEAAIRTQEAKLIGEFVQRAKQVEPNGRLVVADNGDIANILLQSGDTITIPRRSDSVLLSGEVLVSQAMLYKEGRRARDYIQLSGGFTHQALTDRLVLVHANGEVASGENPVVRPGDELIVLPKVPVKNLQVAATIVDILYKIAVAASVAVSL